MATGMPRGWFRPDGARKAHYFVGTTPICGARWRTKEADIQHADDDAGGHWEDCHRCQRRRAAVVQKLKEGKGALL